MYVVGVIVFITMAVARFDAPTVNVGSASMVVSFTDRTLQLTFAVVQQRIPMFALTVAQFTVAVLSELPMFKEATLVKGPMFLVR